MPHRERILAQVEAARDELAALTAALVRIPTVNPPGEAYDVCATAIGDWLAAAGFDVAYVPADGRPEHTAACPRVNVVGRRPGRSARPCLHLNGHLDVVPPGDGWTVDPFGGLVRDGRVYGRGACDMKGGLAAAMIAVEAVRRAGVELAGTIELSATVDEESGGWAGAALLAARGLLTSKTVDFVIIPEPLGVDRICVGHRGVYWTRISLHGRVAHGSMPFLGVSAVEAMGSVLEALRKDLAPRLASRRTSVPVVPEGARQATFNVNAISGGQVDHPVQTPCVADRCSIIVDRRFLLEENFDRVREELASVVSQAIEGRDGIRHRIDELLVVEPVRTPEDVPLVKALAAQIEGVTARPATLVASPGTYDHKHVARIGGIEQCVAYGPGILELAHQPDEWCGIDDLVTASQIMALTLTELVGVARS